MTFQNQYSMVGLQGVRNFAVRYDVPGAAGIEQFVNEYKVINADMLIMEATTAIGGTYATAFTPAHIQTIRNGADGFANTTDDKYVIGYMSLGTISKLRPRFSEDFAGAALKDTNGDVINGIIKHSDSSYTKTDETFLNFWDAAGLSAHKKWINDLVDQGYNGTYIDVSDIKFFLDDVLSSTGKSINFNTSVLFEKTVNTIISLADYAKSLSPDFKIVLGHNPGILDNFLATAGDSVANNQKAEKFRSLIDAFTIETSRNGQTLGAVDLADAANTQTSYVLAVLASPNAGMGAASALAIGYANGVDQQEPYAVDIAITGQGFLPYATPNSASNENFGATHSIWPSPQLPAGDDTSQTIAGTATSDRIAGLGGNDTLYLNAGHDIGFGGNGNDTIWGWDGNDYITGDDGADSLGGDAGDDLIDGGAGFDQVFGGNGNDTLIGGDGRDTLNGGTGNDLYVLGGDDDVVADAGGIDTMETYVTRSLKNFIGIDCIRLTGSANIAAVGNGAANRLEGNDGANTLDGGGGADVMVGGAGNDIYITDGNDVISEAVLGGSDTVRTYVSAVLGKNLEHLALRGTAAINGTGNALNNAISGNSAANRLEGGDGNDTLYGDRGNDTLIGGSGVDSFVFSTSVNGGGIDTISDFASAIDRIRIDDAAFSGIGALGALGAARFVIGAAATDTADRIVYDQATGKLYFDADGSGTSAPVQFAQVTANTVLVHTDFLIY